MEYIITLTEAEDKAMAYIAVDVHGWIQNVASNRARIAMEEIFQDEIARMVADPAITDIPADMELVVLDADILSAAEVVEQNPQLRQRNQQQPNHHIP